MDNYIEDLIGHIISNYRLEGILGSGGMGVVYKARHILSLQEVAIKILWPKEPQSHEDYENFLRRFRREAQVITRLNHPSIVRVHSYGELDETFTGYSSLPYIVMSYIPGKTLSDKLYQEGGTLPLRVALSYIEQAADALMHAHQAKVTHRDLKPGNFLLDEHGKLILTDFGIAHIQGSTLTKKGEFIGTWDYAAPEVQHGGMIDTRADIYSLGVILFEMLMGDTPAHTNQQHFIPSSEIDSIIQKAMAPRPEDRYATPQQFALAIHQATERLHSAPTSFSPSSDLKYSQMDIPIYEPPMYSQRAPKTSSFQIRYLVLGVGFTAFILIMIPIAGRIFVHTPTAAPRILSVPISTSTPATKNTDLAQAATIVKLYYSDWAQKNYASAYALLDQDYQNENPYASLMPYYQHTLKLCITIGKATQLTNNTIKVDVTDNAVEDSSGAGGSSSVINLYQGYFLVKHQPTGWRITPSFQFVSANGQCDDPL